MAQNETWARRLLREMKIPADLLQQERYWTPVFLRVFLDHVEEVQFRDPRAGLKLAKVAPRLALLVPPSPGADGRREHRENLVRAHSVRAACYRVAGLVDSAESEYARAVEIAEEGPISPIVRADLDLRLSTLRAWQRRFAEALALIDGAEAAFRATDDRRRLSEVYAVRGYALNEAERFVEATRCHGEALTLALSLERARTAAPAEAAALARVVEAARTNLAYAVSESPSVGLAATALGYIHAAHRELRGRRNSLTRHLLQWTEGKLYMKLHLPGRAERRLKTARRGFVRLEVPWETALVSLDLAALYRARGEWTALAEIAADTFRRFRELCGDFEAIAALSLWVDAVEARKGAAAAIDAARGVLEARGLRSNGRR